MAMNPPYRAPLLRQDLQWKAVHLQCLDKGLEPIERATASGFLVREESKVFLYTAWHVVSEMNPHALTVPPVFPRRRWLRVSLQDCQPHAVGSVIGGMQSIDVPLYEDTQCEQGVLVPLWFQGNQHIANDLLNPVGLYVPFWHDVVRLEMPASTRVADMQTVEPRMHVPRTTMVEPGEKCFVVGYPYGFSAAIDADQPTPVVLTRFIASTHISGKRNRELLLDGYGAPSMSGCPVFLERGSDLYILGVYTGVIHPGHRTHDLDKATALATVAPLSMYLTGALKLVQKPDEPLTAEGWPAAPSSDTHS